MHGSLMFRNNCPHFNKYNMKTAKSLQRQKVLRHHTEELVVRASFVRAWYLLCSGIQTFFWIRSWDLSEGIKIATYHILPLVATPRCWPDCWNGLELNNRKCANRPRFLTSGESCILTLWLNGKPVWSEAVSVISSMKNIVKLCPSLHCCAYEPPQNPSSKVFYADDGWGI